MHVINMLSLFSEASFGLIKYMQPVSLAAPASCIACQGHCNRHHRRHQTYVS